MLYQIIRATGQFAQEYSRLEDTLPVIIAELVISAGAAYCILTGVKDAYRNLTTLLGGEEKAYKKTI